MSNRKRTQGCISVSRETHDRLRAYAKSAGRSMAEIVATVTLDHINKIERERAERRAARAIPAVADALRARHR
jgi:predicted DNA-binding protein